MHERGEAIDAVVQAMVMHGDFTSTSSAQFFDMATDAINIGYAQMRDVLLPSWTACCSSVSTMPG